MSNSWRMATVRGYLARGDEYTSLKILFHVAHSLALLVIVISDVAGYS